MEFLEKIGLSDAEGKVYLALLRLGSVSSGNITRETEMRKSTVYESIRRLEERGLVSHIIVKGMKHFTAAAPERLLEIIDDRKREIDLLRKEADPIVESLAKEFSVTKPRAQAHVLSGIEGFKTMRRDVLRNARGEHLLIGAISRESEVIPGFFEEWNKERQKRKIRIRLLHKESAREKLMVKKEFMGKYFETRFLPAEVESPAVINIYGERVVNVLWQGNVPLCFLLINKEIADSYRKYFSYLWKESHGKTLSSAQGKVFDVCPSVSDDRVS